MGASYLFTPNAALDTSGELETVTQGLNRSLDDLEVKVQQFSAANEGASPANYALAQAKWNKAQVEMNNALIAGRQALDEIHAQYVLADNKGAQAFGHTM